MAKDKKDKSNEASAGKKKKRGDADVAGKTGIEAPAIAPRMKTKYATEVAPALAEKFGIKNKMRIPRLKKITLNVGLGRATANAKIIEQAISDLAVIAGQKPVATKATKSISNFKLREGQPIGVMVTLRGDHMWEFFDRLVTLALPRIRDFRGIHDKGFDGRGNFTMGLKDHHVFPEVSYESAESSFGFNITMVTSTDSNEEAYELIKMLGFPFRKRAAKKEAA